MDILVLLERTSRPEATMKTKNSGSDPAPVIDGKATGRRIKYYMKKRSLKPADIQKYLSLTCVQTVYRWMDGKNIPTVDNLYALSQLFEVKMDDLIVGNRKSREEMLAEKWNERIVAYCRKWCGRNG